MLDDFLADTNSGHNIVATVFVQAISMYRDSGPVEMRPVGRDRICQRDGGHMRQRILRQDQGGCGYCRERRSDFGSRVEPVLAALLRAGGDRFRGIRLHHAWDADTSLNNPSYPAPPGLSPTKTFREGFAVLAVSASHSNALAFTRNLTTSRTLRVRFPDTKIVLNHVGRLVGTGAYAGKLKEEFPRWAASMKRSRHMKTSM